MVRQHGVQAVRKRGDDLAEKHGAVGLGVGVHEGDVGELGHPIDRQEHEQLALRQAQLADVDMDVAHPGFDEALALGRSLLITGQAGDAVAHEAAVQRATR
jgi:hypothetical protein